ncbi:MAG TPA: apolipoprotein N-acyltransferase, partial [Candidatus Udaeobacter sp.]|nr:apolipoprotein N-acyltransferase [Candidatus Udaeobacter sp.]
LAFLQGSWVAAHIGKAPTRDVLIVQGNIGREIKFNPEYRTSNLEQLIALSEQGLAQRPEPPAVIVWAETAAPCYVRRDPLCRERLMTFVDGARTPLLTGTPDVERMPDGTRRYANAAVVLTPGRGLTASYAKVKLVPFGEAIPYQERLPWLARIDFGEADFIRGQGFTPVAVGPDTAGIMICFESIFPAVGRAYANHGARYLVNITNDEWFGKSGGPYQHAQMAVARAIETRRGLVRCANTGVSLMVDRLGRVTHATALFEPALVRAPVELGSGQTIYARIGDLLPALVCVAAALGALAGIGGFRDPRLRLLAVGLSGLLALTLPAHAAIGLALGLVAT